MAFSGLGNVTGLGDIVARVGIDGADTFKGDLSKLDTSVAGFSSKSAAAFAVVTAAVAAVGAAIGKSVDAAVQFETGMSRVNTILRLSNDGLGEVSDQVLNIARNTPQSIGTLTAGLYDLASSGVSAADSQSALSLAAKAATAGITSVDVAVRAGMANINAYNIPLSQLQDVYDRQFKTVELGVLTYEQYAGAIGNVLPSASRLKVSLDEVHAALATMTLGGIDAQSASTFLARALDEVTEKSGKFKEQGIDVWGPDGAFVGMSSLLEQLTNRLQGLPIQQQTDLLKELNLQIQSGKAISSLSNMYEKFGDVLGEMTTKAGSMNSAFEIMNKTTASQYQILKNDLNASFTELGTAILPSVKGLLDAITGIITLDIEKFPELARSLEAFKGFFGAYDDLNFINVALAKRNELLENAKTKGLYDEILSSQNAVDGQKAFADSVDISNRAIQELFKNQEEARKKQEELNKEKQKYIDSIAPGFKQAMADINAELYDFANQLGRAGGVDMNGMLEISPSTVQAMGDYRGHWNEIPPLIGDAKRNTDLQALAEKEAKEQAEKHKDQWATIVGIVGNLASMMPGLNSESQRLVTTLTSAAKDILGGDIIGGATTLVTQTVNYFKNQADEANKQELRTFQAYSQEYVKLVDDINKMTDINKTGIDALIRNFETLEQSGKYNREQLTPILRDHIRAISDLVVQEQASAASAKAAADAAALQAENWDLVTKAADTTKKALDEVSEKEKEIAINNVEIKTAVDKADDSMKKHSVTQETYNRQLAEMSKESKEAALGALGIADAMTTQSDAIKAIDKASAEAARAEAARQRAKESFTDMGGNTASTTPTFSEQLYAIINERQGEVGALKNRVAELSDAKNKIIDFNKSIEDTQGIIGGLMAKESELQRQTMTGAGKIYDQMRALRDIISSARDEDKAGQYNSVLYNLNAQVDALTGSLTKLQIQWGDFTNVMAGNDTLNQDLKTVGDAIDKVKYYGLDLSKTNVDEQINQAINNMTNFMATLNPQSQAYQDALAAITKLQGQFIEMGGVLDPNASQSESIIAKANAGIESLQNQLNALFVDSNTQEMQIKTDITSAIDNLKTLEDKLKDVETEYGTTQFSIDIDIKRAEIKIAELMRSIGNLSVAAAGADDSDKGGKLHNGGLVTAHGGSLFPNETMVRALKNEFMLRPAATVAFGSDRLAAFNTTLNPDILKRQDRPAQTSQRTTAPSQPVVQIFEATPQTYAKITDRFIAGRIKYRDRKLEVGANPYA